LLPPADNYSAVTRQKTLRQTATYTPCTTRNDYRFH
jgi:hypothetical protein